MDSLTKLHSNGAHQSLKNCKPGTMAVIGMGLLFFIFYALAAYISCYFRAQYDEQQILSGQQEIQQGWLNKSVESIDAWRNGLIGQAQGASEAFAFLIRQQQESANIDLPAQFKLQAGTKENAFALKPVEIQNLLRDFVRKKGWNTALFTSPAGEVLSLDQAIKITPEEKELARAASQKGQSLFGQILQGTSGLCIDLAEPVFEFLGSKDAQAKAVLLLNLPLDKALGGFLAWRGNMQDVLRPAILADGPKKNTFFTAQGGAIHIETALPPPNFNGNTLPFMRRASLDGKSQVYSTGAWLDSLSWLYCLEIPATQIDSQIASAKTNIYGIGILASLTLAVVSALAWAKMTRHASQTRSIQFDRLNSRLRRKKLLLDSVNSSLGAGLALVDGQGCIQMNNRAFAELCSQTGNIAPNTPLVEVMPANAAIKLLQDMVLVNDCGQSASVELNIAPNNTENNPRSLAQSGRFYRVTLSPYRDHPESGHPSSGCVATFQDITEFRRKAEETRQRQTALVSALVRAIESVDPNLPGHSDKMAALALLLSSELQLPSTERETLCLAAQLSQVGKIFVPRELLNKKGVLSKEERQEVLRAPEYADRILHDLHFDLPVQETVRQMGERMDGSGFPHGLQGEEISYCGRILAVVNAFIAMTSTRAWRDDGPMSPEAALEEMLGNLRFDQDVVAALSKLDMTVLGRLVSRKPKSAHGAEQ